MTPSKKIKTKILRVDPAEIGHIESASTDKESSWIQDWNLKLGDSESARNLVLAAKKLREESLPVAFPTETVYGLGADATRSDAVKAIFTAKQRPADNPLIVHFASIKQLEDLLQGPSNSTSKDVIPQIYQPLIDRFWPGPLTILLPLPTPSPLAPEVNAGLATFGARIPASPIALALIHLANVPVAAPSANASTRPSPTAAGHVLHDLDGRLEIILDGGPCDVGVESTVVDGLISPPVVLRPGGIGVDELRTCAGWENVVVAYEDKAQDGGKGPRAPGMKYKHYSPRAQVILHEVNSSPPTFADVARVSGWETVGFVRTTNVWRKWKLFSDSDSQPNGNGIVDTSLLAAVSHQQAKAKSVTIHDEATGAQISAQVIDLGPNVRDVARGLFSSLRELDSKGVKAIFVEGISDGEGNVAAAVMNRLRKAAQ